MGGGKRWVCAHACSNPQRLEEGVGYPGAGVIGSFEISGVAGKDLNSGSLETHPGWCWGGDAGKFFWLTSLNLLDKFQANERPPF